MIYTLTCNPSVDYFIELDNLEIDATNRINKGKTFPGGKGINVSRVLKHLDVRSIALGFIGGFTGRFVEEKLKDYDIDNDFTYVDDDTRINVKIKDNNETEINGIGPKVSENECLDLLNKIKILEKGDILIISGSAPSFIGNKFYLEVIKILTIKNIDFIIDIEDKLLIDIIKLKPLLIKPNIYELSEMFNVKISTREEAVKYGKKLLDKGAKNVIVSMAAKGALMISENKTYFAKGIKITAKNSVGAGDSMIAGFLSSYLENKDVKKAFIKGVASGTATAFSEDLAEKDLIEKIEKMVILEEL
ncbi:MAG: 1-phosphofructokinase [Oscillospiraceae bacterium]